MTLLRKAVTVSATKLDKTLVQLGGAEEFAMDEDQFNTFLVKASSDDRARDTVIRKLPLKNLNENLRGKMGKLDEKSAEFKQIQSTIFYNNEVTSASAR